jgi:hypothetical protein
LTGLNRTYPCTRLVHAIERPYNRNSVRTVHSPVAASHVPPVLHGLGEAAQVFFSYVILPVAGSQVPAPWQPVPAGTGCKKILFNLVYNSPRQGGTPQVTQVLPSSACSERVEPGVIVHTREAQTQRQRYTAQMYARCGAQKMQCRKAHLRVVHALARG